MIKDDVIFIVPAILFTALLAYVAYTNHIEEMASIEVERIKVSCR